MYLMWLLLHGSLHLTSEDHFYPQGHGIHATCSRATVKTYPFLLSCTWMERHQYSDLAQNTSI